MNIDQAVQELLRVTAIYVLAPIQRSHWRATLEKLYQAGYDKGYDLGYGKGYKKARQEADDEWEDD